MNVLKLQGKTSLSDEMLKSISKEWDKKKARNYKSLRTYSKSYEVVPCTLKARRIVSFPSVPSLPALK